MATQQCRRCGGRFARRDDACSWCGFPAEPRGAGLLVRAVIILGVAAAVCCVTGAAALGLALYAGPGVPSDGHRLATTPDAPGPVGVEQPTVPKTTVAAPTAPEAPTARPPADENEGHSRGVQTLDVPDALLLDTTQPSGKNPMLLAPWETQELNVLAPGQ